MEAETCRSRHRNGSSPASQRRGLERAGSVIDSPGASSTTVAGPPGSLECQTTTRSSTMPGASRSILDTVASPSFVTMTSTSTDVPGSTFTGSTAPHRERRGRDIRRRRHGCTASVSSSSAAPLDPHSLVGDFAPTRPPPTPSDASVLGRPSSPPPRRPNTSAPTASTVAAAPAPPSTCRVAGRDASLDLRSRAQRRRRSHAGSRHPLPPSARVRAPPRSVQVPT